MSSFLSINDLHITVERTEVVRGFSLTMERGEVHALMGPNGSGKSSLVSALAGHPSYTITKGEVRFLGEDLLALPPDERAKRGLFLAFQYPREIAGVSLRNFLYSAYCAQWEARHPKEKRLTRLQFQQRLEQVLQDLHMDLAFAERSVNQGFSGGEKKKAEVLQLTILEPILALLDETDSGLDIDALKIVAQGVEALRSSERSFLIVTHYARILEYITPDHVHVMVRGKIVESGGAQLAGQLEEEGYRAFGG
ncbi:Fe-S cluster assembly ATPase SufC [Candidatus Peregrinibacteria bacterium CG10_big_fil_rev_8_21_14_0_10_55_24]|nr:MAG: Fe-S cluster assembly ATPase SufC [Candidatus Peregrinibacteria bacterium CG10_big_fil_rev_8_21_14_0_10_55_24]